eukprot:TRINITY_DN49582_c0_g1_i1.p1 TRINITY_DN49582_c0_g1~~TRINITY_DN49582_c0_g1_i1.p1  ORF type:complete len:432 (+),score=113.21 TRINITY_DN49582_c0_g1_i1:85-1380(+)
MFDSVDSEANEGQHALEQMDEHLAEAERKILAHHNVQLTRWTREQQLALQRAAQLDDGAIQARAAASQACITAIKHDIELNNEQRHEACDMADRSYAEREIEFKSELCDLGRQRTEEAKQVVRRCAEQLRSRSEEWEENAWAQMEQSLSAIAWRQARAIHHLNLTNGVAEAYNCGELQPYLDIEREGWARSQQTDMERLKSEIDAEVDEVFKNLESKLHSVAPNSLLSSPALRQLSDMAQTEKQKLAQLEKEVCESYAAEIDAALHRVEEDYRGYDCELQEVIFRTLDQRYKNAATMRQLKLALCRWRLDYQRVFHDQCARLASTPEMELQKDVGKEKLQAQNLMGRRQLEQMRKAVQRIWTQGRVPIPEIHKFVARVTESCARDGLGEPLLQLYMDELKQYGALPLLEHAGKPEILNVWLESLTAGRPVS